MAGGTNIIPNAVREAAAKHGIFPKDAGRIMAAVSGGADSVCMLHALHALKSELGIELCVAHLNHGIRGEEADADEEFVGSIAGRMEIEIYSEKIDVPSMLRQGGPSLEQLCRRERMDFYVRAMDALGAQRTAVAHTMSDQAETMLFRLIRGTAARGLAAMDFVNGNIVRPLLGVSRGDVLEYCSEYGVEYRVDSTNFDENFTRNRIRHTLLPIIKDKFNTNVEERLFTLSRALHADDEYLETEAARVYAIALEPPANDPPGEIRLKLSGLTDLHDAILSRVLLAGYYNATGLTWNSLEQYQIVEMMKLTRAGKTGGEVSLPGNVFLLRDYDAVVFKAVEDDSGADGGFKHEIKISEGKETFEAVFDDAGLQLQFSVLHRTEDYMLRNTDPSRAFLDMDKLGGELTIRNWREGDRFFPLGMGGMKKIQDFFTDEKIPAARRKSVPLMLSGGKICWAVGMRIDDRFKITPKTERILSIKSQFVGKSSYKNIL